MEKESLRGKNGKDRWGNTWNDEVRDGTTYADWRRIEEDGDSMGRVDQRTGVDRLTPYGRRFLCYHSEYCTVLTLLSNMDARSVRHNYFAWMSLLDGYSYFFWHSWTFPNFFRERCMPAYLLLLPQLFWRSVFSLAVYNKLS